MDDPLPSLYLDHCTLVARFLRRRVASAAMDDKLNMLSDQKVIMDSLKLLDATNLLQAVTVVVVTTVGRWPVLVLRPVRAGA